MGTCSGNCEEYVSHLLIIGRVPVRIEHYEAVGTDKVETTTARLAAEHEDEYAPRWIVKLVDELLALLDAHRAIQADKVVPTGAAQTPKQVQRLPSSIRPHG